MSYLPDAKFDELFRRIKNGDLLKLRHELDGGINPNLQNRFGWTLLMLTALEGNTKIGTFLIDRGADVAMLNNFGDSALSLAAHEGHILFLKLLKSHGASGDVRPHRHDLKAGLGVLQDFQRKRLMPLWQL